jgi:ATP-dependent DNA helicase RecG
MFALLDIGERAGSGLYGISKLWKEAGWKGPELTESFSPDRTQLSLEINTETVPGMVPDVTEKVSGVTEKVPDVTEDKRITMLLELIKSNPLISTTHLAGRLNVSRRTIHRDLDKLREKNMIERIGPDKGGYWCVK